MKHVYETLELLAETKSNKEKQQILKARDTPLLRRVLQSALDPFTTYGVKELPDVEAGEAPFMGNEWLLLEELSSRVLSGTAAKMAIASALQALHPHDGDILARILTRDLRAGIDASTVNKVFPGLIPVFTCMLAQPFEEKRVRSWPVLVQPKLDGVRCLVLIDTATGGAEFVSRNGKPLPALAHLAAPVLEAVRRNHLTDHLGGHQMVLDGEVTAGDFLATVSDVRKKTKVATEGVLTVFDALPGRAFFGSSSYQVCARERLKVVEMVHSSCDRVRPIQTWQCFSADEVYAVYNNIRSGGGEGVIVKDVNAPYEMKRSYGWMKIKDCLSLEAKIVDVERGTGKYSDSTGAIVVDVEGVQVRVGSGLTDQLREEIWNSVLINPGNILGRIVEVEYHEKTAYGSLRHPRFVKFRDALSGAYE